MPSDYAGMFDFADDGEDDELSLRRRTSPMYDTAPDVGIDPNDPATAHYMARAREPLPSQGMYEHFLASKPDERDPEFKSSLLQKIGAGLFGAFGQKGAAERLIHPGYKDAFEDWQTEAKFLPSRARSADVGRQRELESEKFGIIGQAKKRQFEETQRTHKATEADRSEKARIAAEKAAAKEEADRKQEERRTKTDERLAAAAELANSREARAQRAEEDRLRREKLQEHEKLVTNRTKDLKAEEEDIPTQVRREITSDPRYRHLFTRDDKGKIVPTEEGEAAGIRDLIDSETNKRLMVSSIRHGRQ
jgi:hypothetical protein